MSSSARHPSPLTGLLVNAAELLRRPGNWKDVEIDVESKHFEFEDPRLLPQLVGIHLHLECSNNGIVLSGNVSAQWESQCCRCLKDISGVAVGEVSEIYQREITDPDAYRLESDQLNLAPMVREHVLLAVPDTPVCRPDCPGLCPVCGVDRSTPDGANCGCSETPVDPRWDALRDLGNQFPQ